MFRLMFRIGMFRMTMNKFHFNKYKKDTWKCNWLICHITFISNYKHVLSLYIERKAKI